jgi:hypothetical protein
MKLKERNQLVGLDHTPTWQDRALRSSVDCMVAHLQQIVVAHAAGTSVVKGSLEDFALLKDVPTTSYLTDKRLRKKLRRLLKLNGYAVSENDSADLPGQAKGISTVSQEICCRESNATPSECGKREFESLESFTSNSNPTFESHEVADISFVYRLRNDPQTLHICTPMFEIPGDFRVYIGLGSTENPGRKCHTRLEVMNIGLFEGKWVTKVKLHPVTGRRHQLRLHSAHIGHPIGNSRIYDCV